MNTDSQGNATYDFTVPSPGSIYVKAIVNENGKEIINRGGSFWAPDKLGQWSDFQYRDYDEKTIKLVPDKKSYRPGETAHVLAIVIAIVTVSAGFSARFQSAATRWPLDIKSIVHRRRPTAVSHS